MLYNRAAHRCSSLGTGAAILDAPLEPGAIISQPAWQSFSSAGVAAGATVRYLIFDGAQWEYGPGVWNSPQLSRPATAMDGSIAGQKSSTNTLLSLTGNAIVFIAAAAEDFPTTDAIQDIVASLIQNGPGITWVYDDGAGTLTPTVTITQYTDEMVDDRVATLIQNGTGITWSYNDAAGTLTPTVTITQYSDEMVDDRVAALIQNGTGITWAYNDGVGTLTPTVTLAPFSTTNLAEGANLYYTSARVAAEASVTNKVLKAGDTMTGTLTLNYASPTVVLNKTAVAQFPRIEGQLNGVTRWNILPGNDTAEGGSNAGSDFQIARYNDAGVFLGNGLLINRASGLAQFPGDVTVGSKADPSVTLNKSSGNAFIAADTSGSRRWALIVSNSTAEGGSNAGSDFQLNRFSDAGGFLATPISITRSNGNIFLNELTASRTLELNSSKVIESVASPAFSVHRNGSNQSITDQTLTKIQWTTEEFDTNSNFDNATNYRFTPTVAGKYQINLAIAFVSLPGSATFFLSVYKNGVRYKDGFGSKPGAAGIAGANIGCVINMNGSSDYLEAYVYHEGGVGISLDGRATVTYFDGVRVSP